MSTRSISIGLLLLSLSAIAFVAHTYYWGAPSIRIEKTVRINPIATNGYFGDAFTGIFQGFHDKIVIDSIRCQSPDARSGIRTIYAKWHRPDARYEWTDCICTLEPHYRDLQDSVLWENFRWVLDGMRITLESKQYLSRKERVENISGVMDYQLERETEQLMAHLDTFDFSPGIVCWEYETPFFNIRVR